MESKKNEEFASNSNLLSIPSTSSEITTDNLKQFPPKETVEAIESNISEKYDEVDDDFMDLDDKSENDDDDDDDDGVEKQYTHLGGYNDGKSVWGTVDNKKQENECISQFLNGELTFSEYAARMEGVEEEEILISVGNKILSEMETVDSTEGTKSDKKEVKTGVVQKIKKRYVRRSLPPALKGLMGEANLRYARGDKDTAVKICLEIIREVPTAPEPYHTLAGLYEELGHSDKSLQMSLIAAHLSPSDPNQWIHLAEVSHEQGNFKQAITCYTNALKADEKNIEVYFKRAELLEKEGQKNIALKGFSKLLTVLDPGKEGEKILELSKLVAEMYHKEKDLIKTKETLEIAFEKCPKLITSEHVNLLLEVLLNLKQYSSCLELLITFCDLSVEVETESTGALIVDSCTVPAQMAIDIKVKLILALIHMKSVKPLKNLIESLLAENPEDVGDLYLDVAEAFMAEGYFDNALTLLLPLISSKSYSLPAVWLRYAECLKNVGRIESSVKAYLHVIDQAPQHNDARLVAAELLTKLGRRDEAVSVLVQDEKCEILDPDLLYERCLLLKDKPEHADDFLTVGQLFLSRHFIQIRRFEELRSLSNHRGSAYKKKSALKEIRVITGDPLLEEDRPEFTQGRKMPSAEEEWDLFMYMCHLCFKQKKFALLQRLAFSAQGSDTFSVYSKEIDLLCLMSSFYNADSYLAFNYARQLVLKDINKVRPWNVFNLIVIRGDDTRHNKFIMRLLTRNQAHPILSFLHANNCLVSGTYKYALNEYAAGFRKENSPMLAFLIGVTLSQMACQKFSAKKHSLVSQSVAFFSKYKELRGAAGIQEYHYNLGRVYHQLGLLPPALYHYKMALENKPSFVSVFGEKFDLSREAAFNVHLIYMQSGANDMARMYLEKYITV
ncbi:general transcription factor 3C polypeptide 3-like isoform X1 [Lycorma delicatula]|uniref:general transcription factor 3C polypeptide 3-like isoform X1 n=1 Tax=Lycorma delicatula TaxID=130591 RepID=UPI003F51340D